MQQTKIDKLLRAQAETANTISRLMLTLVGFASLGFLALGFPDSNLLTTRTTVTIPFAGPASFGTTLILLPVILICVRVYLQIYVDHWHRLNRISQRFRLARDPTVSPLRHPLLRACTGFVLYVLVPLVLGVLTYEAMAFPGWAPIMLGLSIAVAFVQVVYARWPWPATILPPIVLLAIVVIASNEGLLDALRRPLQLQLVNLDSAILERQDLRRAYLVGASLRKANAKFTLFGEANLWGADLSDADLKGSVLESARLGVANLSGANLKCTNFEGTILEGAIFDRADLKGANFHNANTEKATFREAKLTNADLSGTNADLTGATLCCTTMPDGTLEYKDCHQQDITVCNRQQYCEWLLGQTHGD